MATIWHIIDFQLASANFEMWQHCVSQFTEMKYARPDYGVNFVHFHSGETSRRNHVESIMLFMQRRKLLLFPSNEQNIFPQLGRLLYLRPLSHLSVYSSTFCIYWSISTGRARLRTTRPPLDFPRRKGQRLYYLPSPGPFLWEGLEGRTAHPPWPIPAIGISQQQEVILSEIKNTFRDFLEIFIFLSR